MWLKIKESIRRFMAGRHGVDQLSYALLLVGIVFSLLSSITKVMVLYYVGLACYIWSMVRIFSRNHEKRYAENQKYLSMRQNFKSSTSQFFARMKNAKKFKYFRCPECKARLRLPRKVGEVTVTCGKCHHQFRKKA